MNIIDIGIILIIIMGGIVGFKRGFFNQLVSSIGFFVIVVLSFLLKNPLSVFLYEHLPFFKFGGIIKGVTVLNIFLYEIIAFIIILSILTVVLKVLISVTNIFENIIKFTIVLTPISKIGGLIIGIIESYFWAFLGLYIISLPIINVPEFNKSKFKDPILEHTPILSSVTEKSMNVINDFSSIKDKYKNTNNPNEFNKETLDLFLKYDVVTVDSIELLVSKDKLVISNIDEVLDKYKEE